MSKTDATAERAARLVDALRQQREQGGTAYPLTVAQLKEVADPTASDEDLAKALAKKPYAEQILLANRKDLASPIVASEDRETLLESPLLLEYALSKVCSTDKPLQPIAKVIGVVDKDLREEFQTIIEEQIEQKTLPTGVGSRDEKGKQTLYLDKFPPPPIKIAPSVEFAEKLLTALRAQKEHGGEAYPATLTQLTQLADPEGTGPLKKALTEPVFQSTAVVVPVGKADTLVVLAEDRGSLLESPRLLEGLLRATTTAKKPSIVLDKLAEPLPEAMRPEFTAAIQKHVAGGSLPALVAAKKVGEELQLHLKEHVPDYVELGERLLETLRHLRQSEHYPPTWPEVLHQAAPQAAADLVEKVLADKNFKNEVVFALPGHPDSPVFLKGDEEKVASSPKLLESAVGLLSTADQPLHPVNKIAGKLDKGLREHFEKAIDSHRKTGTLPKSLTAVDVKEKAHLHLSRHPLPTNPVEDLVEVLLADLKAFREEGGNYPTSLSGLLTQAEAKADDEVTKKALGHKMFTQAVVLAQPGNSESLIVLAEDQGALLDNPRLLEQTLSGTRTADSQAVPVAEVGKKLSKELQAPFIERIEKAAEEGKLPAGISALRIKGKVHLFLAAEAGAPLPKPTPAEPAARKEPERAESDNGKEELADFAAAFDKAFERLDRAGGSHNLVSLATLRQEVPTDREVFDTEIQRLRHSGRYSLSAAEGRHGMSEEEREAGIQEGSHVLLFVSRKGGHATTTSRRDEEE